ncbi:MAG TPA: hypothetical protein VNO20_09030 [Solirubrobacterales bacterium]|nr:hypothetical protein [Solirubrobacterales bacterium]
MAFDINALATAVRAGSTREVLLAAQSLIAILREDPDLVALTAHPVGFAHAKLAETDRSAIRLHLWPIPPIATQDPPWLVHRHAWPLTSYVVHGAVINQTYRVTRDKHGSNRLYSVGYDRDVSVMTATDVRVSYELEEEQTVTAGERYLVDPNVFHSTLAAFSEPTATIAVTGAPHGGAPSVIGAATGDSEYQFKRRDLSTEQGRTILNSLPREPQP